MNKKSLAGLIVIVLLIIIVYIYAKETGKTGIDVSTNTPTSTSASDSTTKPIKTEDTDKPQTYIPVSVTGDTGNTNVAKETYKSPITNTTVSFTDLKIGSRNPSYSVMLDGKAIGEVGGYFSSVPKFSPTNAYLSFQVSSVCGANCAHSNLYLVNFASGKLFTIKPPAISGGDFQLIDFYIWSTNGSGLDVTAYSASADDTHGFYRTSTKQVWHYDISTGAYSLVSVIPD